MKLRFLLRQLKKRVLRTVAIACGAELPWAGRVTIAIRYTDGSIEVHRAENVITNVGKNMFRDILQGAQTDGIVRWVALGSGTTVESNTQTTLVTEQFRKVVTKFSTSGLGAGQVQTISYIAPADANTFTITEIGWFASPTATSTANSGIMIARILLGTSISKTSLQSITITRTDSIG